MSNEPLTVYGRLLSPFTRRVLIWAALQDVAVDHRPIQVMGDEFEALKALQGTGRVPLVVQPSGESMIDSWAICDWLESVAPAEKRLLPADPEARRAATQALALAHSMAEKAVAFVYETQRRPEETRWAAWAARLEDQTRAAMTLLEARVPVDGYFGGHRPNGADVAAVAAHDFVATTNRALLENAAPRLAALAARAGGLAPFAETHPSRG